jgi:hypothetical protein
MQQVGNALGVAITGVVFFGAAQQGISHAFELSLAELAVLLIGVALLSRLLPPAFPPTAGRVVSELRDQVRSTRRRIVRRARCSLNLRTFRCPWTRIVSTSPVSAVNISQLSLSAW